MGNTILVVDDEQRIREVIRLFLKAEGFEVLEAADGQGALDLFRTQAVDLIILDVMLPDMDGYEVCRAIRVESDLPILFLSALGDEDFFLLGYRAGADDYIAKPFKAAILAAKVKRMVQKMQGPLTEAPEALNIQGLRLSPAARLCSLDGENLQLSPKEFDLLYLLVKHKSRVLSREDLLRQVWGYDFGGESRVVDNHIKNIRKKLGDKAIWIKTVISHGYKFEVS